MNQPVSRIKSVHELIQIQCQCQKITQIYALTVIVLRDSHTLSQLPQ